ncbi:MlaE family lipid ABC transporter permease subunit [Leptolyngbya sp. FACHB-261]|uniref:MlaE family lipid ABC transporter permease subunit n=1 Tax=Leptolyngbya sp. FACHB-261 TaxID=2692806 RepID=UPI001F55531C|nr:MlaE family lipid ABC transporter permease subunit [Leptolyngbya sp. FACHB-261]
MLDSNAFGPLGLWLQRLGLAILLGGQVLIHLLKGKLHRRNTLEQMSLVGTDSVGIALITAAAIGAVFTIQVAREFIRFGATSTIGGVLAIALTRELAPLLTAIILAGRVGSAFAAEIGTMQVTEQIDALQILRSDPIDYLVVPRVVACSLMLPVLTMFALVTGLLGGMFLAYSLYDISQTLFLDSVRSFLRPWDLFAAILKAIVFGALISVIGTGWGLTTTGGAKGVGQSTTTAVVTSLLAIFISNFFLTWLLFQGFEGVD